MIVEKEILNFLRGNELLMEYCNDNIYLGESPAGIPKPYIIIYPIDEGRIGKVGAFFAEVQLSLYGSDQFELLEMARFAVDQLDGYRGDIGDTHTDSMRAERKTPMRQDTGAWMCPVIVEFVALEEN